MPNIFGSSVQNSLHVTLPTSRILRCLLVFWKICTPLWRQHFIKIRKIFQLTKWGAKTESYGLNMPAFFLKQATVDQNKLVWNYKLPFKLIKYMVQALCACRYIQLYSYGVPIQRVRCMQIYTAILFWCSCRESTVSYLERIPLWQVQNLYGMFQCRIDISSYSETFCSTKHHVTQKLLNVVSVFL